MKSVCMNSSYNSNTGKWSFPSSSWVIWRSRLSGRWCTLFPILTFLFLKFLYTSSFLSCFRAYKVDKSLHIFFSFSMFSSKRFFIFVSLVLPGHFLSPSLAYLRPSVCFSRKNLDLERQSHICSSFSFSLRASRQSSLHFPNYAINRLSLALP